MDAEQIFQELQALRNRFGSLEGVRIDVYVGEEHEAPMKLLI